MKQFAALHPLLVHRTVERADTLGEAFDILSDVPAPPPLVWDPDSHRWAATTDLYQSAAYFKPD